ncbi:PAS domain S-box protein, partial [Candidatus Bathyarchaeota archaeon]|nr:PAS domain S-box protein [Candidatus Bathyarchaeota archaeon]
SKRFCDFFELDKEDIIGKTDLELFPEEVAKQTYSEDLQIIKTGKPIINKEENAKGTWVLTTKIPRFDKNGKTVGLFGISRDISERKKAEAVLRGSEEKWRSLAENAPNIIVIVDRVGTIQFINRTVVNARPEEIVGKSIYDFIDPQHHNLVKKTIEQVFQTGEGSRYGISGVGPKGSVAWYETHAGPIKHDGQTVAVTLITTDLTERRKMEQQLRIKETAVASSVNGVAFADLEGKLTYVNSSFLEMWGYANENEVLGRPAEDFWSSKENAGEVVKALGHKGGWVGDLTAKRKDGSTFEVQLSASTVKDETGKPSCMMGSFLDVTERRKVEQALHASLERYRSFIEVTEQVGWTTNADGEIVEDIPSFRKFTGQTYEEVKGWGWSKALHPDDLERATQIWKEATRTKNKYETEYRLRRHDGVYRYFMARGVPVLEEDGSIREWVGTCIDITERKKTEQAFEESEDKYRGMVELAPDGILAVNAEGVVTSANRSFLALLGYGSEEGIVGKPFTELKTSQVEDIPKFQSMFMSLMKGESPSPVEFLFVRRDGTSRWAEVHPGLLIRDGKPVGAQVIMRDITERKNAEKLIQERQQIFEQLFISNPEAAVYVDQNERVLNVSPRFTELFGYTFDEVKGKFLDDFVVPEDRKKEAIMLAQKGREGYVYHETVRKNKEGSLIPVAMSSSPTVLQGQHLGDIVTYMDITERKKAEKVLEESEERFRAIFEGANDGILAADVKTKGFAFANPRMCEITGYSLEELLKLGISDLHAKKDLPYVIDSFTKQMQGKLTLSKDIPVLRKDERVVYCDVNSRPIKIGSREYLVGLFRDATERKKAEESLKELNKRLEVTNEKLHVVGGLTRHDVRNKLSAVTGNAYLLRQKLAEDPKALEQLADMEAAVRLVEKIFEFARIYEKLGTEQLVNIDVGKAVDGAVSLFSDLKGARIVNECGGLTVLADSLLSQLFYNLIDNSLKYGENTRQIKIHYRAPSADQLELVYEDDGVGIPDSMRSNLFKEGFTSGKGTGYGLFMIKRICEVYGWTILETGKQGKGAQFTINMPKAKPDGKPNCKLG